MFAETLSTGGAAGAGGCRSARNPAWVEPCAVTRRVEGVVAFVGCGQPERCLARQTAAMTRAWLIVCFVACGGTQAATTIHTPQDYEHVVGDVVERVIEIFRDGGINCNMISGELRALNGSQKVDAARRWRQDHPESNQTMKAAITARKGELEKVMGPAARQCEGPIQGLVAELTE